MDIKEYHKMAAMEEAYWWHQGKKSLTAHQLAKVHKSLGGRQLKIINIGCGTGGTVPTMRPFGTIFNVDTSKLAIQYCQERGIENAYHVDGSKLPFDDNTFDVAIALDVLEHIEQDDQALDDWYRVLKPGGFLIITVPAHQWLWSGHDISLHHFRRYTPSPLRAQFQDHGFAVTQSSYAVAFSFPMVVGYRFLEKMIKKEQKTSYVAVPPLINNLFAKFLDIESVLLDKTNLPLGTSVLMVGQKPL